MVENLSDLGDIVDRMSHDQKCIWELLLDTRAETLNNKREIEHLIKRTDNAERIEVAHEHTDARLDKILSRLEHRELSEKDKFYLKVMFLTMLFSNVRKVSLWDRVYVKLQKCFPYFRW